MYIRCNVPTNMEFTFGPVHFVYRCYRENGSSPRFTRFTLDPTGPGIYIFINAVRQEGGPSQARLASRMPHSEQDRGVDIATTDCSSAGKSGLPTEDFFHLIGNKLSSSPTA